MENVDKLRAALVSHLASKGISIVPKRTSAIMWVLHFLLWPFMKLSGKSFIDDFVTTGLGKIFVCLPANEPQTVENAIASISVTTLAHELTHVYQSEKNRAGHALAYLCPQLPIMLAAVLLVPVHVWLASLSEWAHLISALYIHAIVFSFTPLVAMLPWRPRFDIEHDAYVTSIFTLHALYGFVDPQYPYELFTKNLSGSSYLWPAPAGLAQRAAVLAYERISRKDPSLLDEPARKLVRQVLG